jgi:hypothetical protein
METVRSSETWVKYYTTRRHIPEDGILYSHRLGNLHAKVCKVELSHVEAGSNTSTVALRVVEGDENGTQYLGV